MIAAIKVVRVERKLGLKEAKDLVDAYIRSQPSLRQKMEQAQAEMWQKLKPGLITRTDRCRRRRGRMSSSRADRRTEVG